MRKAKIVYVGLESSGKSLLMAEALYNNINRNARWLKITGIMRPIYTNMSIAPWVIDYAQKKGIEIRQWSNLWDLVSMQECDLYIDELATYFDSRFYESLPLDIRLWLAQAEKMGVMIIGGTQDYFMIDISFRRLVKQIWEVRKMAGSERPMKSAPPIKRIWGWMFLHRLDPYTAASAKNQTEIKTLSFFPLIRFITKKRINLYDTQTRVKLSEPTPLRKVVRICPEDGYRKVSYY